MKKCKWLLITTVLCLMLMPLAWYVARAERGNNAIGGEVLIPFIPALVIGLYKAIRETFENG